jgi:hypothetical protein
MEKTTLKLGEILKLEQEINGFTNPESGAVIYNGFLKQNLPILLKYELQELSNTLKSEKTKLDSLRDDLVLKYGESNDDGGVMVKTFIQIQDAEGTVISEEINPKFIEFDKEYGELLSGEKEIEYPEITKEDLKNAGDTKDDYKILFKLIKK